MHLRLSSLFLFSSFFNSVKVHEGGYHERSRIRRIESKVRWGPG